MKLPPYVKKSPKTGALSFRLAVPHALRQAYGKREITRSLKTKDPATATVLALRLYEEAHKAFEALRGGQPSPENVTDLEAYREAIAYLRKLGLGDRPASGEEREYRSYLAEQILERHRDYSNLEEETFPTLSNMESFKVAALEGGLKKPPPTIEDALDTYLLDKNPQGKRTDH